MPCVLHGRSLQLGGCGVTLPGGVEGRYGCVLGGGMDGAELWMLMVGDSAGRELYLLGNALLDPTSLRALQAPRLQLEPP